VEPTTEEPTTTTEETIIITDSITTSTAPITPTAPDYNTIPITEITENPSTALIATEFSPPAPIITEIPTLTPST